MKQPKTGRGDYNNFGPRVGLAWDPQNNGVMNIHAAYGMFYDNMRTLQNFSELTWPQAKQIIINTADVPRSAAAASRATRSSPPRRRTSPSQSNDTVNAYAHQFNAGVSRTVARDIAVTADVSIMNRYSDRDTVDPNLPDQVTKAKLYPQFARVNFWQSTANNTYRALLLKVDKRMSNRYQFLVVVHAQQGDGHAGDQSARRSLRLLLRSSATAPPIAATGSSPAASCSCRPTCSCRRSPTSGRACRFAPSSALDLNGDGYTDRSAGRASCRARGCRDLNLDAVNTFRRGRAA